MNIMPVENEIEGRFHFVGYTEEDRNRAAEIWSIVEHDFEDILHRLYVNILREPAAPHIDPTRVPYLIKAQKSHWRRLLNDCFEKDYAESVRRAGAAHHRLHVAPRWYIGAYSIVTNSIIELLARNLGNDAERLAEYVATLNRHVAIDMDLALSVYTSHVIE